MFGRKKQKPPARANARPEAAFTVRCEFGCTRLECSERHEAEVFLKCMGRCPQCGGELFITP